MAEGRSLALPAAIVVGSAILGASIYLGLRHAPASPAPASAPEGSSPPLAPPPAPSPSPAEPVGDRVYRQAQAALDGLRPALVKACWTPPGPGEPAAVLVTYDVTFGADGGIVALGISEQRDAFRTSVAECLRKQPRPALPVDPPGQGVRVVLGLPLP